MEVVFSCERITEKVDKSSRKVARVTEQLDAAHAANSELETELRKLKVRTGSMDYHTIGGKLGSPFSEDMEDDYPKKKNNNVLKKIGVLLKKGQK
nr:interactor of constitutive active ROPs 2, chloroplastic-like [Ipomoea batatas]